jgi:hypothetical protein
MNEVSLVHKYLRVLMVNKIITDYITSITTIADELSGKETCKYVNKIW